MTKIFQVTDCRGWTVYCTEECWKHHILSRRPHLQGWENEVIATLQKPSPGFVYQDAHRKDRHTYYRRIKGKDYYLKVVIEVRNRRRKTGEVITAFLADAGKSGELIIWPTSKG